MTPTCDVIFAVKRYVAVFFLVEVAVVFVDLKSLRLGHLRVVLSERDSTENLEIRDRVHPNSIQEVTRDVGMDV